MKISLISQLSTFFLILVRFVKSSEMSDIVDEFSSNFDSITIITDNSIVVDKDTKQLIKM